MSPTQYRALERLSTDGPMRLADGPHTVPGRIHPRTAEALQRRGLVTLAVDERTTWATITDEGERLLTRSALNRLLEARDA